MISQTRILTVEDLIESCDKRQSCLFFDGKGIQRKLTVFQSAEEYMRIYTPILWSDAPKSSPTYSARTQSREESGSSQANDSYIYIYIMHKMILSRWWSDYIPEDVARLILLLQSCSSNFVALTSFTSSMHNCLRGRRTGRKVLRLALKVNIRRGAAKEEKLCTK